MHAIIFVKQQVLVHSEGMLLPRWQDIIDSDVFASYVSSAVPMGDDLKMIDLGSQYIEHKELRPVGLRDLLATYTADEFQPVMRAWQYALFMRTHQYCGQCGDKMRQIGWEMARQCDCCGHRVYPRISPCIIVAIRHEKQILLAQGPRHVDINLFSTLAGFVESGETLEQAVAREVFEEVGVQVKNIEYFGSQPWPFPHSLMVGFIAEYAGGEIQVDGKEIIQAQWFDVNDLPNVPPKLSIAGRLIEHTQQLIAKQG